MDVAKKSEKSKKNKMMFDYDYIDNMQLNFNNEDMIISLPFWLKSQKAKDGKLALSDGTDYLNVVLQLTSSSTSLQYCKETFSRKGKVAT